MLINIGKAYIRAEDIRQINAVEKGTEEDKRFGLEIYTNRGNFRHFCEGQTERKELLSRILRQMNGPSEELAEIRKQLTNINTRLNQIEKKLKALQ